MSGRGGSIPVALGLALGGIAAACGGGDDDMCGEGTVYDAHSRTCVLSADICAPGSVLVQDHCEEETGVIADVEEAAEPNDANGLAGTIPLPDLGSAGVILHGCIDPYVFGAPDDRDGAQLMPDVDSWAIQVTGPTLLDVTSDGVGGLAAGFLVLAADSALQRDAWARWAFSLAGSRSRRQLFLPAAGSYELSMSDSRALVAQLYLSDSFGAGGPHACYYTTVRSLPLPEAVDLPLGEAIDAPNLTSPRLYRFHPDEGDLLEVMAEAPLYSPSAVVGTTLLIDDAYVASSFEGAEFPLRQAHLIGGFTAGEEALIVVDAVYDYSPEGAPRPFHMTANRFAPQPLTLGTPMTLTNPGGAAPVELGGYHILRFDAPADDVIFTDLDFSVPTRADILDGRGLHVADVTIDCPMFPNACEPSTSVRPSIRYATAGRHYLRLFTPDAAPGSTLVVTAQMTPHTPSPLALGSPIVNVPLGPRAEAWYVVNETDQLWLQFDGDVVSLNLFDPSEYGTVDSGLDTSYAFSLSAGAPHGLLLPHADDDHPWLVRVSDPPFYPPDAVFDLTISQRSYTDLGSIAPGGAIDVPAQGLPAGGAVRYFVRGEPGERVTVTVTPDGFDARVRSLHGEEFDSDIDEAGPGQPETIVTALHDREDWVAFDVQGDAPGAFEIQVTGEAFPTYAASNDLVRFADACGPGEEVPLMGLGSEDPEPSGRRGAVTAHSGAVPVLAVRRSGEHTLSQQQRVGPRRQRRGRHRRRAQSPAAVRCDGRDRAVLGRPQRRVALRAVTAGPARPAVEWMACAVAHSSDPVSGPASPDRRDRLRVRPAPHGRWSQRDGRRGEPGRQHGNPGHLQPA